MSSAELKRAWNVSRNPERSGHREQSRLPTVSYNSRESREMALFLLVFLTLQALVLSTQGQEAYDNLSEDFKKGVNLALQKLSSHSGVQHHFLFFRSITKSDINPGFDVRYIYHHFLLKPTHCPKGTSDSTVCHFRNDRPPIDCAVCYKTFGGDIEAEPKPYVHCIHKPSLTEDMKALRIEQCNIIGYGSGTPTLLASRGD